MDLETASTPPILIVSPTGTMSPDLEVILLYSSILVGVCSEVSSKVWLLRIKRADESPMFPIVNLPSLIRAMRQVVPSEY